MHTTRYIEPTYLSRLDGGNGLLMPDARQDPLRIAAVKSGTLADVQLSSKIAFSSLDDDIIRSGC